MDKTTYKAQTRGTVFCSWLTIDQDDNLTALRARVSASKALKEICEVRILEITHIEKVIEED